jgi:hypothetical protein
MDDINIYNISTQKQRLNEINPEIISIGEKSHKNSELKKFLHKDVLEIKIPNDSADMEDVKQLVLNNYNTPLSDNHKYLKVNHFINDDESTEITTTEELNSYSGPITVYFDDEEPNVLDGGAYHNRRRSSSTARRSASSRRRRSSKKRGTQRKQKRRQRRGSRRA